MPVGPQPTCLPANHHTVMVNGFTLFAQAHSVVIVCMYVYTDRGVLVITHNLFLAHTHTINWYKCFVCPRFSDPIFLLPPAAPSTCLDRATHLFALLSRSWRQTDDVDAAATAAWPARLACLSELDYMLSFVNSPNWQLLKIARARANLWCFRKLDELNGVVV